MTVVIYGPGRGAARGRLLAPLYTREKSLFFLARGGLAARRKGLKLRQGWGGEIEA